MFTGIIETMGIVQRVEHDGDNLNLTITSEITSELKIDQSVSHNGICLTVVAINGKQYTVTAVHETILKTNISDWREGNEINLERGMRLGDRLDGHIVQGHVDQTGLCIAAEEGNGSWEFRFSYDQSINNITIEKGSITVNGVSLTVVDSEPGEFSVAIIPYTFEHTNFKHFTVGTKVNLEFDVVGKYISRLYAMREQ
ncbi:riboflavin synthase [Flavobacterium sp. MAH-1]|uniref:Riboflavin synthase n=1 Tax=Flavobacterium agri TaxID=2743471 RepID=A0A7Y8Y2N6_9FLAO|nr:riboflavin synthase [Flavobacterium agri]NUY81417.1 riboflavin synthase [Flavobacterium agri]NYA71441.1 riboflavin synthase [Flavobacterium agri]